MNLSFHIDLLKGFAGFNFGRSISEAERFFGKPEETQILDDDILETSCTVLHFWDKGFSLFFDNKNLKKFSSVEVDNKDSILFDTKLFSLSETALIEFMKSHNFQLSDTEEQEWGEKRLSFDEAGLDCYFENGKMTSINFGVIDDINTYQFLPN
jgi:hypothetical protein